MKEDLKKKVNRAIRLLQSASKIASKHGEPLEICYSCGKDSEVILELAKIVADRNHTTMCFSGSL